MATTEVMAMMVVMVEAATEDLVVVGAVGIMVVAMAVVGVVAVDTAKAVDTAAVINPECDFRKN